MSCFEGRIEELKNVSIDFFESQNLYSTTYFLSHCHSDHMEGLRSDTFLKRLKEEPHVFLYCSEITAHILKSEQKFIDVCHKIKEIQIGPGSLVLIPGSAGEDDQEVTVTLIPTGHCPGAVMFLFEGDIHMGRILYTGDFRILLGDASKFKQLHYLNGTLKEIDKLYLDTTFLSYNYQQFPPRKDVIAVICDYVRLWLAKGEDHHAIIQMPAKYGSEAVFMAVAKQLGTKIHVSDAAYSIYRNVSELRDAVTNDPMITQIHACLSRKMLQKNGEFTLLPCRVNWFKLVTIRPCALTFTSNVYNGKMESAVLRSEAGNLIRVCYSCHSSHEELRYFIEYLKPKQIEACVVPRNMTEIQMLSLMRKLCLPIYGKENLPVLTVSKRRSKSPTKLSPVSKTTAEYVEEETDIPSSSFKRDFSYSVLKADSDHGRDRIDVVKMEDNVEISSTTAAQSDADIYRLIAEDLQPKNGDQDADIRQSMSLAFLTAAKEQKKPVMNKFHD